MTLYHVTSFFGMKLTRFFLLPVCIGVMLYGLVACNSDDDADLIYTSNANTMVRTFSLAADIDILTNLSYRYFTIDLVKGQIYNPDSFPYGTDISALVPDITFDNPSSVEIKVLSKDDGSLFKTIDYLEDDSDSIDFNNDVKMKVVAADGVTTQEYRIEVRVHRVQADSLVWATLGAHTLPTLLETPVAQKTVAFGDKAYCFTTDGTAYSLGVSSAPADRWDLYTFAPWGDTLSVSTIVASSDTLFALCGTPDADGNQTLCRSTDGLTWTPVADARFAALIGVWNERLTGVSVTEAGYVHATYEAGTYTAETLVETNFPVSGYSNTIAYSDTSYGTSQIYFFGGRCADNSYSGHIWAYDGVRWAALSKVGIAGGAGAAVSPREGALFFSYYNDEYNAESDYFVRKTYYYILGGKDATGVRNDLYYTNTLGGYWEQAAKGTPLYVSNMGFTSRAFASAYISEESAVIPATSLSTWQWAEMPYLSRVTRSSDEAVPYVYVFGGYDSRNNLIDEICRGVVLRFTF